jgi:hypothetical protein
MDNKEFNDFLESVATVVKIGPNGCAIKPQKKIKQTRIEIDEWGEEIEIEEEIFANGSNPTIQPIIKELKPVERPCQLSCGKIVEDQKIHIRLYPKPYKHFRTHCNACMKWLNPYGEIVGSQQIESDFIRYFAERDK